MTTTFFPEPRPPFVTGIKIVWGLPKEQKPIVGFRTPTLKMRLRFRAGEPARAWVRICTGVIQCLLSDNGDSWGLIAQGENRTR